MRTRRTGDAGPNGTSRYMSSPPDAAVVPRSNRPEPDEEPPAEQLGEVRIARRVLRTVVAQAALSVPGAVRLARLSGGLPRQMGRPLPRDGIRLVVRGEMVTIDLYLIVAAGAGMVEVGSAVQEAVAAAVEHILGMGVGEINIYIQDVA